MSNVLMFRDAKSFLNKALDLLQADFWVMHISLYFGNVWQYEHGSGQLVKTDRFMLSILYFVYSEYGSLAGVQSRHLSYACGSCKT